MDDVLKRCFSVAQIIEADMAEAHDLTPSAQISALGLVIVGRCMAQADPVQAMMALHKLLDAQLAIAMGTAEDEDRKRKRGY